MRDCALWDRAHGTATDHFGTNSLSGLPQILCDYRRTNVRSFGELANLALPTADKNRSATGARSSHHVRNAIADHVPILQSYAEVSGSLLQHTYLRLAAAAALTELLDCSFGMVQAVINAVDVSTHSADF